LVLETPSGSRSLAIISRCGLAFWTRKRMALAVLAYQSVGCGSGRGNRLARVDTLVVNAFSVRTAAR